jgi:hypothetical protein
MRRSRFVALGIFAAMAMSGCGDAPLSPTPPEANEALLGLLGSSGQVEVLHRTTPLAQDEVVSETLGPFGGTISLPQAGLTIVVPVGALTSSTTITVTAPAGDLVGYHFQPHGLVFRKPLTAAQRTWGTDLGLLGAILSPPFAAYFQGELQPTVEALEILNLNLLGLLGIAQFQISHFSGYVIATD